MILEESVPYAKDYRLSIPEAAFVCGLGARTINGEIDARIISVGRAERTLEWADLLYLEATKEVRRHFAPELRKSLHKAIFKAVAAEETEAHFHHFVIRLDHLADELLGSFNKLEETIQRHIEECPQVLNGEPVLRGTRLAVRHLADLVKRGATSEELQEDYEISAEQVEAALIYDRTHPRRGRPPARRTRTTHVPPA
jgi:uncharacterized protein (DUF433 family)